MIRIIQLNHSITTALSRRVHGCVVSSSVLELFGTFSFKRKGT